MDLYEEFGVGIPVQAPNAVSIAANAISSSEIDITVSWAGGSLTGIPLFYATNAGGPWTLINTFLSGSGTFRHLSLAPSTTFYYQTYAIVSGPIYGPATYANATTSATGLTITTASLTNPQVGFAYSFAMSAAGGTLPYTWNMESDSPNFDLWEAITGAGVLYGTPQKPETETLTIRVTDAVNATVTATFTQVVNQ